VNGFSRFFFVYTKRKKWVRSRGEDLSQEGWGGACTNASHYTHRYSRSHRRPQICLCIHGTQHIRLLNWIKFFVRFICGPRRERVMRIGSEWGGKNVARKWGSKMGKTYKAHSNNHYYKERMPFQPNFWLLRSIMANGSKSRREWAQITHPPCDNRKAIIIFTYGGAWPIN